MSLLPLLHNPTLALGSSHGMSLLPLFCNPTLAVLFLSTAGSLQVSMISRKSRVYSHRWKHSGVTAWWRVSPLMGLFMNKIQISIVLSHRNCVRFFVCLLVFSCYKFLLLPTDVSQLSQWCYSSDKPKSKDSGRMGYEEGKKHPKLETEGSSGMARWEMCAQGRQGPYRHLFYLFARGQCQEES